MADSFQLRAHPRSRGEHSDVPAALWPGKGSSPLTRGAPHVIAGSRDRIGLIPAHAGSTAV
ncbi:hypothetical protein HMPREF3227_02260 [Corynebacterium sp. CMW7794]|nr:hypothetical protein HMPREF3227_02260 [Corynebacterium sp. CMW7794]